MKIVVPMAGFGDRFVNAGYTEPKPLIKANGKRLIEHIVDMFDKENDEFVFICNKKHAESTDMVDVLESLVKPCTIIVIENHKLGPVHTVNKALDYIDDEEEVIVTYCDNPYLWNYSDFKSYIKENDVDGCILSHTGFHPHRLSSTYMAYMKMDGDKVVEVKEKEPYTDNHWEEPASTGTYYFKKGSYIKNYFQECIDKDINFSGEFYVTLVYNVLIANDMNVGIYDTDFVTVFGTPEELENFEAWVKILDALQVKNEKDLIKCYRYWKEYHENS